MRYNLFEKGTTGESFKRIRKSQIKVFFISIGTYRFFRDGVNDGPALITPDAGIVIGLTGTDAAIERRTWTIILKSLKIPSIINI